ncbi:RNA polymerase sigma-70 factor [Dysgonomonas sp. ZJ709]|uniref:RNA polymerase sigma-70 factor n=1 Tax=Dysgonomonas sp. ZJ709 TaxID=2709797 RepID=UPI0013EB2E06|nr:RNA polymerase sigma-70 factor [Dysgonomonas sp. ZJ709]
MEKDKELEYLKRLAANDHEAFKALFVKYFPKVKYFIAHLIKSDILAEDFAQDIFTKIWLGRADVLKIQSFNSYIYRMAKNAVINYSQSQIVERNYAEYISDIEHVELPFEEELYAKEINLLIQLSVNNMPPQRKKVYEMSRVDGLANEEIANQLNLSKKTVENHLNLALKEIRKTISLFLVFFM